MGEQDGGRTVSTLLKIQLSAGRCSAGCVVENGTNEVSCGTGNREGNLFQPLPSA